MLMYMNDMKEFMNLVLKIAFNQLHLYKQSQYATTKYDELFAKKVGESNDLGDKVKNYIEEFVHETHMGDDEAAGEQLLRTVNEQRDHMFYSSMVVMFRALKVIRI
jgi:hypothetical protein